MWAQSPTPNLCFLILIPIFTPLPVPTFLLLLWSTVSTSLHTNLYPHPEQYYWAGRRQWEIHEISLNGLRADTLEALPHIPSTHLWVHLQWALPGMLTVPCLQCVHPSALALEAFLQHHRNSPDLQIGRIRRVRDSMSPGVTSTNKGWINPSFPFPQFWSTFNMASQLHPRRTELQLPITGAPLINVSFIIFSPFPVLLALLSVLCFLGRPIK